MDDETFRLRFRRLLPEPVQLTAGQMIHHLPDRSLVLVYEPARGHIFASRAIPLGNNIYHCLSPVPCEARTVCRCLFCVQTLNLLRF